MSESQTPVSHFDYHTFRGQFMDQFAQIEHHAFEALDRLVELDLLKKHPHLFGQKFKALLDNVERPGVWKHVQHVKETLNDLAEFVRLRGPLGHSVMGEAKIGTEFGLFWHPPGHGSWDQRKTMTKTEALEYLAKLEKLVAKFKRQPLANPASSPPPPSQGAADGP